MTGDYLELTTARLRAFSEWEHANPPEAGVVSVTRDTHGRFWQAIATRAAADAAVSRAGGRL